MAVLNALGRLAGGYESEIEYTTQQLSTSESQLKDYHLRQGQTFTHEDYTKQLAELRDKLRFALSGVEAKEGEGACDIAAQIKALRATRKVEAPAEREVKTITAEVPVTARIRRRAEEKASADSQGEAEANHAGEWQRKLVKDTRANAERVREPG